MLPAEASWLGQQLARQPTVALDPIVEFGAGSANFRLTRPHIVANIHGPLQARGVRIFATDIMTATGIDVVGDVLDPMVQERLKALAPQAALCCNMFEHVRDRAALARACDVVLPKDGLLFLSVPSSYPYHLDPIDTGFRPKPGELRALFPSYAVIASDEVVDTTYWRALKTEAGATGALAEVARAVAKSLTLRGGVERAKSRLHRFFWLFRPYRVSVAVLRKLNSVVCLYWTPELIAVL